MRILAIDTSGPVCSVALCEDKRITCEISRDGGLTHSETLMPMIDSALAGAGLTPRELDLIAVVAGPGSFTGVRIGVCAARALAHGTGAPLARINALTALAALAMPFAGVICPLLDARRDQVYASAYQSTPPGAPEQLLPMAALPIDTFLDALPENERLYFLGDGVAKYGSGILARFPDRAVLAPAHLRALRAGAACFLAERLPPSMYLTPEGLTPIYLRAPQAERERDARITRQKL